MTVLVAMGDVGEGLVPVLKQASPDEDVVALQSGADPPESDVLVTIAPSAGDVDRALAAGVRWVHVLGAGVDGVPLDRLGDRLVTCSRGAAAPAIAEFVLAAMLAFEKQLPATWITEPPAQWNIAGLGGLRERTLGLVGLGAIGTEIARRALAFDMRVLAFRRTGAASPVPGVTVVSSLAELLGASDHVVVTAAATPQTHHLLDADALAAVKRGAHLVNIARGSLVDQDALLAALDDGRLAMASLDVVDPEPLPAGHPLYSHPKVRLSPHVSWSSPATIQRTIELFVDNLRRWRAGEPLHGVVDVAAGY